MSAPTLARPSAVVRVRTRGVVLLLASTLAFVLTGCRRVPPDATPEGAVRLWLDKMEASTDDPRETREAYALLGPAARANLEERAQRASKLQGRRVEPFEMLAEGRFGLKFRPKAMTTKIDGESADHGEHAIVEVTGDDPLAEHAIVHCARVSVAAVGGKPELAWRVEPELPDVPPRRDATGRP